MKLAGKVAMVTGGSRGIGSAIARALAREGASVAVNYVRNAEAAEHVVAEITAEGGTAMPVRADVSRRSQVKTMIDEVVAAYGRLDILVNNAGIITGGTILDTTQADWDRMVEVNLTGPFHCTQEAARIMVPQRYGKIVNVSSISGLGGAPQGELAYCCAKSGLVAMTTVCAQDLGPYGITVNCVAPGWIESDMTVGETGERYGEVRAAKAGMAAMRRTGVPQDIANVALFLACDDASFVTGQVIVADGGRMDFLSHA
jgi:3-oxoacyl-[acyl-carrier protein] reductase